MPLAIPLATVTMLGNSAKVFRGEHFPCPTHTALYFVVYQQNAVLAGSARSSLMELGGRHQIAAFPLNRFHDYGSDFLGGNDGFEQAVFENLDELNVAGVRLLTVGAAIAVGVRDVMNG